MADREVEKWITVNGRRVPIYKDNVKVTSEYASNLTESQKKTAERTVKQLESSVEELTARHNIDYPDDDLVEYVWDRLHDEYPQNLPGDESVLVFDNNRGEYDEENGKIGMVDVKLWSPDDKTVEMETFITYNHMSEFSKDELEDMGIDIRNPVKSAGIFFHSDPRVRRSVEKAFNKANLIGEDADLDGVIESYKYLRELPDYKKEELYEYLAKRLGFMR